MNSLRVLVIEDNQALVASIFEYLELSGFVMDTAPNGRVGLHLAATNEYDVVVLDLMLPGISGFEVCRRLRQQLRLATPVLMLTAKDALADKLAGFESGADDYLVKPFALPELKARLYAMSRRLYPRSDFECELQVGDLIFNTKTIEISRHGNRINLNPTCRQILETLMRDSPKVVPKERLESELWGEDLPERDILRAHIYTLRSAIDRPFDDQLLKTIPRVGYRIVAGNNAT